MSKKRLDWNETEYTQPDTDRGLPTLKDALTWLVVGAVALGIWALVIWGLGELLKLAGGGR